MTYGYIRVSEKRKSRKENSYEYQEKLLKENGVKEIYFDIYKNSKIERPYFNVLMNKLESRDTLIITKLDRLANGMVEGINILTGLITKSITIHILDIGILDNTPEKKAVVEMLVSIAYAERAILLERTQEGKALAKEKGNFKEGRPKLYSHEELDNAMILLRDHSYVEVVKMTGISKSTLIRRVKKCSENHLDH